MPVPSSLRPLGENQSTSLISRTPPPFITRGLAMPSTQPQDWLPKIFARWVSCMPARENFRQPILRLRAGRSEEHTSELQSHLNLVCRLLLEKKNRRSSRPV